MKKCNSPLISDKVYWTLDMSFGEDKSRIRRGNAPANVAIIRHAALNMIRLAQTERVSIRNDAKICRVG